MKHSVAILLALLALLLLSACAGGEQTPAPEPESSPSSIPEPIPGPAPAASSEPPSPEPSPGDELPASSEAGEPQPLPQYIRLSQMNGGGVLLWELEATDEEEIKLLQELLSVEGLTRFDADHSVWPDGEIMIDYTIYYADQEISGACNPDAIGAYRYAFGWEYTIIATNDGEGEGYTFYQYPSRQGDRLLEFLESKGVTVN